MTLKSLPTKGVYTLVITLDKKISLKVQKLGRFTFQKGQYAYTGSAVGDGAASLQKRVERHLRRTKVKHWHIDFLLANKNAAVTAVVAAESGVNKECRINNAVKSLEGATVPVTGFGASDCRQNCESHLVYFTGENVQEKIVEAYTNLFGCSTTLVSLKE